MAFLHSSYSILSLNNLMRGVFAFLPFQFGLNFPLNPNIGLGGFLNFACLNFSFLSVVYECSKQYFLPQRSFFLQVPQKNICPLFLFQGTLPFLKAVLGAGLPLINTLPAN